jgi:hypothetical protein
MIQRVQKSVLRSLRGSFHIYHYINEDEDEERYRTSGDESEVDSDVFGLTREVTS